MSSTDFYSQLAEYYDSVFPLKKEVARFISGFLKNTNDPILDIGCATGQLAIELARRGWTVKAFDLDETMIRLAKEKIAGQPNPVFFVGNMNQVNAYAAEETYQAAICIGNTLPHLVNKEACRSFVQNTKRVLKPGGWLFIQMVNFEKAVAGYIFPVIENERCRFERWYAKDSPLPASVLFHSRLTTGKKIFENTVLLQTIQMADLNQWIEEAGFGVRCFFGDYSGTPYQTDSPALIVCAQKKP